MLLKAIRQPGFSAEFSETPTLWKNPGMGRVQISRSLEIDETESHFIFLQKSMRHPVSFEGVPACRFKLGAF
jgi:hypothetical protein